MSVATRLQNPNARKVFVAEFAVQRWTRGTASDYTLNVTTTLAPPTGTDTVAWRWLQRTKRLDGNDYLPILESLPNLSLRVEPTFGGVGQLGGGDLQLNNMERWADDLTDIDWHAGTVALKLGVDLYTYGVWDEQDYAEYEPLGVWRIDSWETTPTAITFKLSESKALLENVLVPPEFWTRDEFPLIFEDHEGDVKPVAYGQVYGAKAVCINTSTTTFRVAGHAIHSFGRIRVGTATVSPTATDLANAEFTMDPDDWADQNEVKVDFIGKPTSGGQPMTNPADVVEDLLETYGGETIDFSAERGYWVLGEDQYDQERSEYEIAMLLDSQEDLLDIGAESAAIAGGLFYQGLDGSYVLKHWRPQPSEGVTELRHGDIFDIQREADPSRIISRAVGRFARNKIENAWQVTEVSDTAIETRNQLPAQATRTEDLPVAELRCASLWASRTLGMEQYPLRLWTIEASHVAFLLEPGYPVRITDERLASDVYEVIEVERNLETGRVDLVVGDWRGLADGPAFWTADSPSFPARLGGASITVWDPLWTEEQAQWARENLAFWCNDSGYAHPGDTRSYYGSVWA